MPVFWRAMTGFLMQPQVCRVTIKCLPSFACSAHFPSAGKSLWHTASITPYTTQCHATVCTAQRSDAFARPDVREATSQAGMALPNIQDPSEYTYKYYATCAPGLEELVAAELSSPLIGARDVEVGSSGVGFSGPLATGYRANLWLRCAVRVLVQLSSANLSTTQAAGDSIYSFIRNAAPWHDLIDPRPKPPLDSSFPSKSYSSPSSGLSSGSSSGSGSGSGSGAGRERKKSRSKSRTFSVESRVWDCTTITSTHLATTRTKDAICDALRDAYDGMKPDPPGMGEYPDLPLYLSLYRDRALLYRDMSGMSLHKRGYRDVMHKASLNEGVAAAVLMMAGWAQPGGMGARAGLGAGAGVGDEGGEGSGKVLCDPMCGSGTLLIEAALMACNHAPGLLREQWPFETWPDHNQAEWSSAIRDAQALKTDMPPGIRLLGNDIHPGALSLCEKDAKAAGVYQWMDLSGKNCSEYKPPVPPTFVAVNPPWGSRLGDTRGEESDWLVDTWQTLGLFLKRECSNADVTVLSGNPSVTRELRMKADRKRPITVGGIDCRVMHYKVLPPKPKDFSQPLREERVSRERGDVETHDVDATNNNVVSQFGLVGGVKGLATERKYNFPKRTVKY